MTDEFVCANCGMSLLSDHEHTIDACDAYDNDPTKPDGRLTRIMTERRGARKGPLIKIPTYHSSEQSASDENV